jgi:phenylalanyl-tRNA synthetase beta chain
LDESIEFEALRAKIHAHSGKLLKEVNLFDVFRSEEKVGTNKKSYALNFQLLDREKTLTDKEIDHTMQKIIRVIENEFNATIRS